MKKFLLIIVTCLLTQPSHGDLNSLTVGAELGHSGLLGGFATNRSNTIGIGAFVGSDVSEYLDLVFHSHYNSHTGSSGVSGVTIWSHFFTAKLHLYEQEGFDLFAEAGPGFYFYNQPSETLFGVNLGFGAAIILDDSLSLGLVTRAHQVFKSEDGGRNHYSAMMMAGYTFDIN